MYDSVTLSDVPSNTQAVAGYVGGAWTTYPTLAIKFPKAKRVSIAVNATERADCLDIEPGDAVPAQAVGWYRMMFKTEIPCFYGSESWALTIELDLLHAGIKRSQYLFWDAHYTYVAHIDPGFDGTQWTDHALGRNLDASLVTLKFLAEVGTKPAVAKAILADIGAAEHYERYPSTIFYLKGFRLSERTIVRSWDSHGCQLPVSRTVCRNDSRDLGLLLKRDLIVSARDTAKQRAAAQLPGRIDGLKARLGDGVATTWLTR